MTPMIPACLPPRDVSRPKVPPPPDACDTHAHVFGPAERFRYADDRSYTPPATQRRILVTNPAKLYGFPN
jgi:predicted TIM-barrel fold metal-dependent hydrolase